MSSKKIIIMLLLVLVAFGLNAQSGLAAYGYALKMEYSGIVVPTSTPLQGIRIKIDCWGQNQPLNGPPNREFIRVTDENGYYELVLEPGQLNQIKKMHIYLAGPHEKNAPAGKVFYPYVAPARHDFIWNNFTQPIVPDWPPYN